MSVSMEGVRYGRLVVIQRNGRECVCACDCGETFTADRGNIARGRTRSCGCLARERTIERNRRSAKHGHAARASPEYRTWTGMIQRCTNPKAPNFAKYGGRGIAVCERWRLAFAFFYEDMRARPPGTSLDRIDGTRGYEPGNCRWATPKEQRANRCR